MKPSAALAIRLLLACVALACTLAGCERERRGFQQPTPTAIATQSIALSDLQAGTPTPRPTAPGPYAYNAYGVSEGKRLFSWFNCEGCHAKGGGGIGPALMDAQWIYGGEPENIFATIVQGRPNGMPSFRGRIPEYQVWQLVAYVRSLSGQLRKDVASSRDDHIQAKEAEQNVAEQPPVLSSTPAASQQSQ